MILSSIWGLGKLVRGETSTNKLQIILKQQKKTDSELIAEPQRFNNFIHKILTDSLYIPRGTVVVMKASVREPTCGVVTILAVHNSIILETP